MENKIIFGGQYVSPKLKERLNEIEKCLKEIKKDKEFKKELNKYLVDYVGRSSPLYYAEKLTKYAGGAKIYLKREDLNHTGAHKINNALGQVLLAKRLGKSHIIAETGAGQHGVATATVCALFDIKCTIFMGKEDIRRQRVNVERMRLLGAEVKEVTRGLGVLKDAVDEAFEYFENNDDCFYLIGSAVGPYPYPEMVQYFQKVIGEEAKKQILKKEGHLPKAVIACAGGGSNSIGLFTSFIKNKEVDMYCVEAGGLGIDTNKHSSAFSNNHIGIMHGMKTYIMEDENGNQMDAYSISAGLDYPGIGPIHAKLYNSGRMKVGVVNDKEAIDSFKLLTKLEGIIPALESSHAISYAIKVAKKYNKKDSIIVCLSGRGDKDMDTILNS